MPPDHKACKARTALKAHPVLTHTFLALKALKAKRVTRVLPALPERWVQ